MVGRHLLIESVRRTTNLVFPCRQGHLGYSNVAWNIAENAHTCQSWLSDHASISAEISCSCNVNMYWLLNIADSTHTFRSWSSDKEWRSAGVRLLSRESPRCLNSRFRASDRNPNVCVSNLHFRFCVMFWLSCYGRFSMCLIPSLIHSGLQLVNYEWFIHELFVWLHMPDRRILLFRDHMKSLLQTHLESTLPQMHRHDIASC